MTTRLECTAFRAQTLPDGRLLLEVEGAVAGVSEKELSKRELAAALGTSERTVTNYLRKGLPHGLLGDRPKFRLSEVRAWMERNRVRKELNRLNGERNRLS